MKMTEFTYRQYGYKKKKGVKDSTEAFGQSDWGDGSCHLQTGKNRLGGKSRFVFQSRLRCS